MWKVYPKKLPDIQKLFLTDQIEMQLTEGQQDLGQQKEHIWSRRANKCAQTLIVYYNLK